MMTGTMMLRATDEMTEYFDVKPLVNTSLTHSHLLSRRAL